MFLINHLGLFSVKSFHMSCAHSAICYLSVPNIRINYIDEIKGVVGGYSKICLKCSQIDNIDINFCDWICSVFFYEAVVVTLTITQYE